MNWKWPWWPISISSLPPLLPLIIINKWYVQLFLIVHCHQLPPPKCGNDGWWMIDQWLANGRLMVDTWLIAGWPMLDKWLINYWLMVDQWLINGWSMVQYIMFMVHHCHDRGSPWSSSWPTSSLLGGEGFVAPRGCYGRIFCMTEMGFEKDIYLSIYVCMYMNYGKDFRGQKNVTMEP